MKRLLSVLVIALLVLSVIPSGFGKQDIMIEDVIDSPEYKNSQEECYKRIGDTTKWSFWLNSETGEFGCMCVEDYDKTYGKCAEDVFQKNLEAEIRAAGGEPNPEWDNCVKTCKRGDGKSVFECFNICNEKYPAPTEDGVCGYLLKHQEATQECGMLGQEEAVDCEKQIAIQQEINQRWKEYEAIRTTLLDKLKKLGTETFETEEDIKKLSKEIDELTGRQDILWDQIYNTAPSELKCESDLSSGDEITSSTGGTKVDEFSVEVIRETRKVGDLIIRASSMPTLDILSPSTFTLDFINAQGDITTVTLGSLIAKHEKPAAATKIAESFIEKESTFFTQPNSIRDIKSELIGLGITQKATKYLDSIENHVASNFGEQEKQEFRSLSDFFASVNSIVVSSKNKLTDYNTERIKAVTKLEIERLSQTRMEYKDFLSEFFTESGDFNIDNEIVFSQPDKQDITTNVIGRARKEGYGGSR